VFRVGRGSGAVRRRPGTSTHLDLPHFDRSCTATRIGICRCEGLPGDGPTTLRRAAYRDRLRRRVRLSTCAAHPRSRCRCHSESQSKHSTRTGHSVQTRLTCSTYVCEPGPCRPPGRKASGSRIGTTPGRAQEPPGRLMLICRRPLRWLGRRRRKAAGGYPGRSSARDAPAPQQQGVPC